MTTTLFRTNIGDHTYISLDSIEDYMPGVTPVPPADDTIVSSIPAQRTKADVAVDLTTSPPSFIMPNQASPADDLSIKLCCLTPECEKDGYTRHLQHLEVEAQIRADKPTKQDLHNRRIHGIRAERRQHARKTVMKVDRRENIAALNDQLDELGPQISIRIPVARLAK